MVQLTANRIQNSGGIERALKRSHPSTTAMIQEESSEYLGNTIVENATIVDISDTNMGTIITHEESSSNNNTLPPPPIFLNHINLNGTGNSNSNNNTTTSGGEIPSPRSFRSLSVHPAAPPSPGILYTNEEAKKKHVSTSFVTGNPSASAR